MSSPLPFRLLLLAVFVAVSGCGTDDTVASVEAETGPSVDSLTVLMRVADPGTGRVRVTPIAQIEGGMPVDLDLDSEAEQTAFLASRFPVGQTYAVALAGQSIGTVTVAEALRSEIGYGFEISAEASLDGSAPVEWEGLALGGRPGDRPLRRPLTAAERALFEELASNAVSTRWNDWNLSGVADRLRAFALLGYESPVLVGTFHVYDFPPRPLFAGDEWSSTTFSALVVAEADEEGTYRAVVERHSDDDGYESWEGRPSLFDVVDLNADGSPEVVVKVERYEGVDYEVYARWGLAPDDPWARVFAGGYSGL